jgi:hypothetical protein
LMISMSSLVKIASKSRRLDRAERSDGFALGATGVYERQSHRGGRHAARSGRDRAKRRACHRLCAATRTSARRGGTCSKRFVPPRSCRWFEWRCALASTACRGSRPTRPLPIGDRDPAMLGGASPCFPLPHEPAVLQGAAREGHHA